MGRIFSNRTTGMHLLLDEVQCPAESWSLAPRHVSIALTNLCNLHCSYCYAPKNVATLALEKVIGWIHDLEANGCIGVGFGGGEPTLYSRLPELCSYLTQKTKLAVTLTTHGHNLTPRLRAMLAGNIQFIRISMDGIDATYERLRGRPFANLLRVLDRLRDVCPFGINFVVNDETYPELDGAVSLAQNLGARDFLLLPEISTTTGTVDEKLTLKLKRWMETSRTRIKLSVSDRVSEYFQTCDPFRHDTGLKAYAHITAIGELKRSSFEKNGVSINEVGIIDALAQLQNSN